MTSMKKRTVWAVCARPHWFVVAISAICAPISLADCADRADQTRHRSRESNKNNNRILISWANFLLVDEPGNRCTIPNL